MNANPETQHKVLILGNQEVGKTAIVNSVSFTKTSGMSGRILMVKLKIPGKSMGKAGYRNSVTFKLKFLTLAIYIFSW